MGFNPRPRCLALQGGERSLQDLERVGVVIDVFHGCQSHQNVSVGYEYGKFALDESPSSCWARVQWADGSESTLPQTELIKI